MAVPENPVKLEYVKESTSATELNVSLSVPDQEHHLFPQPLKSETNQKISLICTVKSEESQSPISLIAFANEESTSAIKSENLIPLSFSVNPSIVKREDIRYSATTSPALTKELENFQDLTEWCHSTPKTPKMSLSTKTDELNTPVLELGEFLFTSPTTIDHTNDDFGLLNVPGQSGSPELYVGEDIQSNKFNNDLECQIFGYDSTDNFKIKSETYQYSNVFIGGGEVQENSEIKNSTYMNNNYNINNIFTTKCSDTLYNNNGLCQQTSVSTTSTIPTSVSTENSTQHIFSFAPSSSFPEVQPETAVNLEDLISISINTNTVLPETSNPGKFLPKLDFSNIWVDNKQILSTPEVINTALSLETGFNLINFITEDNLVAEEVSSINISNPEEEDYPSSTNDPDPDPTYTPSESSDDDEDYEPSWKLQKISSRSLKQKKFKTKTPVYKFDQDSEVSNSSTIESVKVIRRGRPPKRNVSVSSDSNADPEISKYRELRDKNNEASRRSRLNRKMKDIEMEQEAKDLDVKNRRLKTQVQELERLVNTMRNNLMQVMLKNK